MTRIHVVSLAALLLSGSACLPAQAAPPRFIVAVFSEEDAQFAETITLYADGSYQQAETEKKTSLYGRHSLSIPLPGETASSFFGTLKRSGAWRVLDKEGGQPLVFKTLTALPKDTVIEVKGAMPFGITWERQPPFQSHGTRTLSASQFQLPPSAKNSPSLAGEGVRNEREGF